MKLTKLSVILLFLLSFNGYSQIKNLYLRPFETLAQQGPFLYYRDEGITIINLRGKYADGNYRIYDVYDSTLVAYIEVKNNSLDGIYIVFDEDKNPTIVGIKKRNKSIGTWLFFSKGYCECVKKFDDSIYKVDFYPSTSIRFYNKKEEVIQSVNPKKIADPNYH